MTRNQVLALRYAEALLEHPHSRLLREMCVNQNLSEEDIGEIYGLLARVTVCFPPELDN